MDRRLYRTGEFARKASVTVRTLRYYDKAGLLRPSAHTEAGYRLYTDEDLARLQQILALKFLGFALGEIKQWLHGGPAFLHEALRIQKSMMREKRAQLDAIITAACYNGPALDNTLDIPETATADTPNMNEHQGCCVIRPRSIAICAKRSSGGTYGPRDRHRPGRLRRDRARPRAVLPHAAASLPRPAAGAASRRGGDGEHGLG